MRMNLFILKMVTHVPMAGASKCEKVLIIGGGDGGVAREFCSIPEIKEIDLLESDEMFMEVSRKSFPRT